MRYVVSASLVLVGIVHVLPIIGVLGNERLAKLYGIAIGDPDTSILMRHRAVLFGLLGTFLIVASFRPAIQIPAFAAGFVSVVSFLWLAWSVGHYNPQVGRVVMVDIVAFAILVVGAAALAYMRFRG